MTPEQVELVQGSFKKVVPIADTAADLFYTKLFEIAPEVRSMFPDELAEQKKKLIQMLATAVNNLHQLEEIVPAVQDLGKRHVGYGVVDAHYDHVGAALLDTLEKGLGEDWTPDLAEAWVETYTILSTTMKEAAAEVPTQVVEKRGFFQRLFASA